MKQLLKPQFFYPGQPLYYKIQTTFYWLLWDEKLTAIIILILTPLCSGLADLAVYYEARDSINVPISSIWGKYS